MLQRPYLVGQLNGAPQITLIGAPAGYGKSTLLREWADAQTQPVAWAPLNDWDNDPNRLARTLAAALGKAGVLNAQPILATTPAGGVLSTLLTQISCPVTLVLDNYEAITNPTIHRMVGQVIQILPTSVRLIIASRTVPKLPLARLRAQGALLQIGAADLAFTPAEVERLLQNLRVSPEAVAKVSSITGGWPALVQLIALAGVSPGMFDSPDIAAFLTEEVIGQLPENAVRVLTVSAIVDWLSIPLCEALTGESGALEAIGVLQAAGLLTPAPGGGWVHSHPLITDLLRQRLSERERRELHRRAAQWHQNPYVAATHALLSQDAGLVADLVCTHGRTLWARSELTLLQRWLNGAGEAALQERPQLALLRAWCFTHAGQPEAAASWVKTVEQRLRDDTASPELRGEAAAIRARLAAMEGDTARAARWSHRALTLVPESDLVLRGDLLMNVGHVLSQSDPKRAADSFAAAARLGFDTENPRTALFALQYLANVRLGQGRLREAHSVLDEALTQAGERDWERIPAVGMVHATLSHLLYEFNDLEGALRHASLGVELARPGQEAKILVSGHIARARTFMTQGKEREALADLRQAERLAGAATVDVWRAQLALRSGDLTTASRWAEETGLPTVQRPMQALVWLQVFRLTGQGAVALTALEPLLAGAERSGRHGVALRLRVQQALLLQATGADRAAATAIARVLTAAKPEHWVRTFVDEGTVMADLLERTLPTLLGTAGTYAARLLGFLRPAPMVEPLSEREQEVLQLLAAGCSNQAIAQRLYVTVGTVKTHVHRIYQKLGVGSRTQAIGAGRSLGLIYEESILG